MECDEEVFFLLEVINDEDVVEFIKEVMNLFVVVEFRSGGSS